MEITSNQTVVNFEEAFKTQCSKCEKILDWEPKPGNTPGQMGLIILPVVAEKNMLCFLIP